MVEALLAVMLLLPLVYLVAVMSRVQAGTFAAETAAREAVRAVVTATSADQGAARADAAVRIALRDQDLPDDAATLDIECGGGPCLVPGAEVAATVHVTVPLPLVPGVFGAHVPAAVHVDAAHVGSVDRYVAVRP
ncbi:pilus assembly protein [Myceligenerans sp. I2]|uniref:Pilus assembly protein n=1 Tax=Myceligenerans indicum TaxID=2593663 RepID=A0ABS1LFS9_9MICO|nr:pilus assembly protein [Myceligenerans indicum]